MNYQEARKFLESHGFNEYIAKINVEITAKHYLDEICFDAWYTNRCEMLQKICELSQLLAKEVRMEYSFTWCKGKLPDGWLEVFEKHKVAPHDWEDSPDGALAIMAVLLAGWAANLSAAKTRDFCENKALYYFETVIRPMINAAMDLGIKFANS